MNTAKVAFRGNCLFIVACYMGTVAFAALYMFAFAPNAWLIFFPFVD